MSAADNVWADFPNIVTHQVLTSNETHLVEPTDNFPEWDIGKFPARRMPTGLSTNAGSIHQKSHITNAELSAIIYAIRHQESQPEDAVQQYFLEHKVLLVRLRACFHNPGEFKDRLKDEFGVHFSGQERSRLHSIIIHHVWLPSRQPASKTTSTKKSTTTSKPMGRAERQAQQEQRFQEKAVLLTQGSDIDKIFTFIMESERFAAMIGFASDKTLTAFDTNVPPTITWDQTAALPIKPDVKNTITNLYVDSWKHDFTAHQIHLKRSAAAVKGAETRRIKRDEAARLQRAATLMEVLEARTAGPEALLDMLENNTLAQTLLHPCGGDAQAMLTLTPEEQEIKTNRQRVAAERAVDKAGIWRKNIIEWCPWIKDSEIEPLYRQGHLIVLCTQRIHVMGRGHIDARRYDPVSVRKLTKDWIAGWRLNRRNSRASKHQ